jgi:hypothetical protein
LVCGEWITRDGNAPVNLGIPAKLNFIRRHRNPQFPRSGKIGYSQSAGIREESCALAQSKQKIKRDNKDFHEKHGEALFKTWEHKMGYHHETFYNLLDPHIAS